MRVPKVLLLAGLFVSQSSCFRIRVDLSTGGDDPWICSDIVSDYDPPFYPGPVNVCHRESPVPDGVLEVPVTINMANPAQIYPDYTVYYDGIGNVLSFVFTANTQLGCYVWNRDTVNSVATYMCIGPLDTDYFTTTTTTTTTTTSSTTTTTTTTTTSTTTAAASTTTTAASTTTTTTTTTTSTPDSPTCAAGVKGYKHGNGYKGFCCSSSDDCIESCVKGICNGVSLPASPVLPSTCIKGLEGKQTGSGYKNYCCYSSEDCKDLCVSYTCNGPSAPASFCISGAKGKKKSNGTQHFCCSSSKDCTKTCNKGKCT